jgi:Zn finger protein HypA/HybF involved in hydrogenase expression
MDELLKNARECLECGQVSPHLVDDYKCWHCRSDEEKEVPELEAQKPLHLHDLK